MCRHGCQRLVIDILAELRDLDGQSWGASSKTARDDKRQRTAAAPTRTRQSAVSGGPYTTAPQSRHVQVVCPPRQVPQGW